MTIRRRALVVDDNVTVRDVPDPVQPGECLIRVRLAGICGTDLQILKGYAGFRGVPGHEFVGTVEDAPSAEHHWIGRRIVGEINVGCGTCEWCRNDVKEHCRERTVLGIVNRPGAFATHVSLPAANLFKVPDGLSDEAAVFVEPTAAACQILKQVEVSPRSQVAVLGDGRLGLLIAQVLNTTGAVVTLFGKHDAKLAVARSLGLLVRLTTDDAGTNRFDVVVDATGRPEGFGLALDMVRPRGTVVLKSTFHGRAPVTLWPAVVNELVLVGSRCGPFDKAIEMLSSGAVQTARLIAGTYPLEAHQAAFAAAERELKVLLKP